MTPEEFERLKKAVALDLARKALESADFSLGLESLSAEQRSVYEWLEGLHLDGEITYGELWSVCRCRTPLK